MNESENLLPQAISHKKLNSLMLKAKKDKSSFFENELSENLEIELLMKSLDDFESISKELINKIHNQSEKCLDVKSSNAILALGAMEAHLNMALQAMHIFRKDQN